MPNQQIGTSEDGTWSRAKTAYFYLLVALTLTIAIVSFARVRGQGLSNVSIWIFAVPFLLTLARPRLGLVAAVFLLTVTPALHQQLNLLAGTGLHAWAFPGVDACLGFLLAWVCKGQLPAARGMLATFPAGPLLLFHGWVALSALVAVARNVWQSASEFSLRGLAYNVWLVRGISWQDDYYPLQDLYFYSVALVMLIAVWAVLAQEGRRLVKALALAVLVGAVSNVIFALWQKGSGRGWVDGEIALSVNALWPDLHSFGAFMAVALALGYGFLRTQSASVPHRIAIGMAMAAAAAGLYLSTSRSTLFIFCIVLILWGGWSAIRLHSWRRAVPMLAVAGLIYAIDWTLERGYRGYGYGPLKALIEGFSEDKLNAVLSHRPEIWGAAIDMYLAFPFFGLGQGSFYRLSSMSGFSGSPMLLELGGSGVHNYFLQKFVELGPIGLIIALLIAVPCLQLGRRNFGLVSFYALIGIAIGNLFAHSLLVRETLMLCAIFAGGYFWEAHSLGTGALRPPQQATMRIAALVAVVMTLIALIEVARSFERAPFTYGLLCFGEPQAQTVDGWTGGLRRMPIPLNAARAEASWKADRPDLERRPITVEFSVAGEDGKKRVFLDTDVSGRIAETRRTSLDLPEIGSKRFLDIRTSNCFVPLNLGLTYNPRRLGLILQEVRFLTSDGVETK